MEKKLRDRHATEINALGDTVTKRARLGLGSHDPAVGEEDLLQQAFLAVLVIETRQDVRNTAALMTRIAVREVVNNLRKRIRRGAIDRRLARTEAWDVENNAVTIEREEQRQKLDAAIERLPESEKTVVELLLKNYRRTEVARDLDIPLYTVGRLLGSAVMRLRRMMIAEGCELT